MPKAILEFNLPEEEYEHQAALDGMESKGIIQEFDNYLRSQIKYGEYTEEQMGVFRKVREELIELAGDILQ